MLVVFFHHLVIPFFLPFLLGLIKKTWLENFRQYGIGIPLIAGKAISSAALCFLFVSTCALIPHATILLCGFAACNLIACLLTRGKSMYESVKVKYEEQKSGEERQKNKESRSKQKIVGLIVILSCISAGATAWCGLQGGGAAIISLLFGVSTTAIMASPIFLAAVVFFTLCAAVSFYSFQASKVGANISKFIQLFKDKFKKGFWKGIAFKHVKI